MSPFLHRVVFPVWVVSIYLGSLDIEATFVAAMTWLFWATEPRLP